MIKTWQISVLVLTVTSAFLCAENTELPAVQRIYTKCEWGLSWKHDWIPLYQWSVLTGVAHGSFWIAQPSSGEPIVVTAYHNLKPYSACGDVKVLDIIELAPDQLHTVANSKRNDGYYNILYSLKNWTYLTTLV